MEIFTRIAYVISGLVLFIPLVNADETTKLFIFSDTFNGNTAFVNSAGLNHDIDEIGNVKHSTTEAKKGSSSIHFDGSNDTLQIPDSSDWDIVANSGEDWTIELWLKSDLPGYDKVFLAQREDDYNVWVFRHISDSRGINFRVYDDGSNVLDVTSTPVPDDSWHHIALIKVGDEYGIYLDGAQVGYTQEDATKNFTGKLHIGEYPPSTNADFNGYMDDIKIHKSNFYKANPNASKSDSFRLCGC